MIGVASFFKRSSPALERTRSKAWQRRSEPGEEVKSSSYESVRPNMKRTFLLVLLALTITSLTTAAAYAELPSGQTSRSGSRGLLYPSPLLLIVFRYMLWRKMRADQDKQWGASDKQWGTSTQTTKQRSN